MIYRSIDITKFIMALFVVTIHSYIINDIQNEWLERVCTAIIFSAVPFFYVTSSYLLFRHIQYNSSKEFINQSSFKSKFKKYWYHIMKMYILWFTIYNIENIKNIFVHPHESLSNIIDRFFFWGCGHLWYLWGLLLVLPIIYKLLIFIKPSVLIIIGFGLTCLFRLYSHYGSIDNPTWWQDPLVYMWKGHIFNVFGICYAWAYISVGAFMATTKKWKALSPKALWLILILSLGFCCIDTSATSIGYQPVAFALVALCLQWNIKSESFFLKHCRDISTYIYLIHVLVISLSHKINDDNIVRWILSLIISFIIALLISITKKQYVKKLVSKK